MNYVARHRGKKTTCEMDSTGVLAGKAFKLFRGSIDLLPGGSGAKGQEQYQKKCGELFDHDVCLLFLWDYSQYSAPAILAALLISLA